MAPRSISIDPGCVRRAGLWEKVGIVACVIATLDLGSCTTGRSLDDGDGDGENVGTSTSTSGSASTSGSSSTTGRTTGLTDGSASTESLDSLFVGPRDMGGPCDGCSIYTQDCPSGQKCIYVENYCSPGNLIYSDCVPIPDDPAGVGEPCRIIDEASALDDCELGTMCWGVDPDTDEGVCRAFCMGSGWDDLYCTNPDETCAISSQGPGVCVPRCNPLELDCARDEVCVPFFGWVCFGASLDEIGGYGDPCQLTECGAGLICLDPSYMPPGLPCEGASGCCTEVCDVTDPAGDLQCTGAAEGQTCQPWWEEGTAPPGFEHVGACALPW